MIEHSGQTATTYQQPSISHKARDEIAEAVAMAAMIEGQARAEAKARQVDAGKNNGRGQIAGGQTATTYQQPSISHKARDEIAEAVAMAAMIEGQARAEAKARQVDALARGNQTMHVGNDSGQLAGIVKQAEFTRKARDEIAEAVGMATTTLRTGCGKPPPVMRRVFCWLLSAYLRKIGLRLVLAHRILEQPKKKHLGF